MDIVYFSFDHYFARIFYTSYHSLGNELSISGPSFLITTSSYNLTPPTYMYSFIFSAFRYLA